MKVFELIEQLQNLDPNLPVYLQRDSEGNGYELVRGADSDSFWFQDWRTIEIFSSNEEEEELEEMTGLEGDELKALMKNNQCVVIFP